MEKSGSKLSRIVRESVKVIKTQKGNIRKRREKGKEIFEIIIIKNFLLVKNRHQATEIQEAQRTLSRINAKIKQHLGITMFKLQKIKSEEKS